MDDKDKAQAQLQTIPIQPGDTYHHYKRGNEVYEVVALAIKEDTLEPLVVYRSQAKGTIWVRTLKNWLQEIEVDGKLQPRFKRI